MSVPPAIDDRRVEEKLRRILAPLDRHLDRGSTLLAAALVVVVPSAFLCVWMPGMLDKFRSAGAAFIAGGIVIAIAYAWDAFISRLALWRFDAAFPVGTSERDLAQRMLSEMQTPTRAEDRLHEMVTRASGDRILRLKQRPALPPADTVPAIDPVPPEQLPRVESEGPGTPGYYDYIPLEPKKAEDRPPLGQG